MANKNSIRAEMKQTLTKLSKPMYEDYSYKIACRLFQEQIWKEAQVIGITISKPPEVDTFQIIRKAWELGKQVAVPKCHPKTKQLIFRNLTAFSQLESVFFELLEPIEAITKEVPANRMDLVLVPGLAYSIDGYRIGFGGGYYDRFLSSYSGCTVSLAFTEQIMAAIPTEEHDIPVERIITPEKVLKVR
ncbi:5-formyltetrahydrofolate cyclo-ligase [Neobacillus dielmonensis]|uniref:5-formyltetrahydrofolate cyclo-ligase n=1 Tax=Neobacillus dielmonensis TaxID=1347369 RepID=UPI0005AA70C4|nr:5-formyltetrahydrofolate cyclo-ligase [Neobacillus dielmonensis]